jgi:hypothetical protein
MRRSIAMRAGLVAAAMLLVGSRAGAQSPPPAPEKIAVGAFELSPRAELRIRGEYRRDAPDLGGLDFYGRLSPRVKSSWVVFERARLGLGVERGAVRGQITLQDARPFGSPAPSATLGGFRGVGQTSAYEAFVEARSSGARPAYLRLGRQEVVWGEGRLVGKADFSPVGRSLDALRGHVAAGKLDVEALAAILETPGVLGAAWNDRAGPTPSGIQLYGLMGRLTLDPLLRIEAYALARIARSSGGALDGSTFQVARLSGETYTGAVRVAGDGGGWDYGVEGAYQLGNAASLSLGGSDIAAWAAAAHLAKTLREVLLTPTFRIGGSYASGDEAGGKYTQFDPLLADPQRFHGQMDLFAWSNMMDVAASAEIVPWTDTTFGLGYRYARLATANGEWIGSYLTTVGRADPTPLALGGGAPGVSTSSELGHEIDLGVAYRPWVPLELRAGYSALFLGEGARTIMAAHARGRRREDNSIAAAPMAHYAFAQATLIVP